METSFARILVVDDQFDNQLILEDMLSAQYAVSLAEGGQQALALLMNTPVDLVLLDVLMPGLDGFEVCRRMKADTALQAIPVLFITSLETPADEEYGLSIGAEDFIHKPFSPAVVLARVRNHLALAHSRRTLLAQTRDLEQQVADRTREIYRQAEELVRREREVIVAQSATIAAFCSLAEARDNETGNHIRRTQHYVKALAERLRQHPRFAAELDDEAIQLLFKSAPLHDIGKVAIPDSVLLKPGPLSSEEWAIMRRHAEIGYNAIAQAEVEYESLRGARSFLRYARDIARSHHERWDGRGYPHGLAGEHIPLSARLMAVADVYDALISKRVYKAALPHESALSILGEGRGSQFDPDIVDAAFSIGDTFRDIAVTFRDHEE